MGIITTQDNTKITYEEWKLLRNNSIGSSEVGAIVYGNNYTSNLEIWWNKVAGAKDKAENIRMWLGKQTEDTTAHCWQYHDDTDDSIVINHRKNTPVKKGENRKITLFNSDYHGRTSTPDLFILPYGRYAGRGEGVAELKNTQTYVLNAYENGIPTDNIFQLCDQMMMADVDYGELFYFVDNRTFKCFPLERKSMKSMEDAIKKVTLPFWKSIEKARPLYNQMFEAKRNFNMKLAAELEVEISRLEPPAQNTNGYLDFLTQRYKDRTSGAGVIKGTDMDLVIAKKYAEIVRKIDKLKDQKISLEIQIKNIIKENNVLDFGTRGKITYFPNKNGNRLLKSTIK